MYQLEQAQINYDNERENRFMIMRDKTGAWLYHYYRIR